MQKLDHSGIKQSNYRTGAPQASGMFHWNSSPPKRLKTIGLDTNLTNVKCDYNGFDVVTVVNLKIGCKE